jgi:hypothetical protein
MILNGLRRKTKAPPSAAKPILGIIHRGASTAGFCSRLADEDCLLGLAFGKTTYTARIRLGDSQFLVPIGVGLIGPEG